MLMITYRRDKEKMRQKIAGTSFPLAVTQSALCCGEDAMVTLVGGILRIKGADIDYKLTEVEYVSVSTLPD